MGRYSTFKEKLSYMKNKVLSPYGIGGIGGDFRDSGYFLSEFGAIKTPGPFYERRNM